MVGRGKAPGVRRQAVRWAALAGAAVLAAGGSAVPAVAAANHGTPHGRTATPVKHLVVIFDENISFDHYFATYPKAANTDGTRFKAAPGTPKDTANLANAGLLKHNPNQYAPKRLTPAQAMTCDQNHEYSAEQYAYHGGKADQFVQNTETSKCSGNLFGEPGLVMDYYDGNTVTALWNYAQHYTLNDQSFGSAYGPSTPGALELVSGQTHGVISVDPASGTEHPKQTAKPDKYTVASPNAKGVGTVINDPDPAFDDCSDKDHASANALAVMTGANIGDRLNSRGVSWGWFQGGFRPSTAWNGKQGSYAKCGGTTHTNVGGAAVEDYSPHHNPFAYYRSTANPHHLAPASVGEIGHGGRANHNYDLSDFDAVVKAGKLPAVSFLKAGEYQDGHAGYSDPVDEQHFLVKEINQLQKSPQWKDTAVVVAYDDSDGWYDHVYAKPLNGSKDATTGSDGQATDAPGCKAGPAPAGGYADRCGPGTRQPLLVISPFAKVNKVDHTRTEQASITRFIEDNWHTGRIGDASFDTRATSLAALFDFRHPNNKQVLLAADGSVTSVRPIPPVHGHPGASGDTSGNAPVADGAATAQLAETGAGFPALPVGIGAAAAVVAGAGVGVAVAVRRRRTA
ncbi:MULTISPECIES: phospholipase C [Streptomycetaceae]|uniref:phospholipase C n=1 Tax=Streptantibioticus cattleyicolor (strain ATCC 35852 / DSM 46488 / JCM 4925 / NBRC 14057 / NRRL 8057) TaxID=1003195 RepID=F8JYN8_STREN|nr:MULTISPECIES: alkaline phosphatase family protein [Streptomycetaceae]AEW97266.1 putative acid phosphatase [Streptantibioticus cattleyicolor NRRL 8057 = DSM 46488]MYS61720.1 phospholipase [Streptomyces sp. SID5468]CCB77588.1 Phospholipase C [Streptantibioticus cattleyicolor NRRL 8057 = DSM 46488]